MFAEAGDGAVGGGLVELDADPQQADDAARSDETRGEEGAGGDFGFDGGVTGRRCWAGRPVGSGAGSAGSKSGCWASQASRSDATVE